VATKSLIDKDFSKAISILASDTTFCDSFYWHFKLGIAYFNCHDYNKAIAHFSFCVSDSTRLKAIALSFLGDIEKIRGNALKSSQYYLLAKKDTIPSLLTDEINRKLLELGKIFPKILDTFPEIASMIAEKKVYLEPVKDTIGLILDSLLNLNLWQTIDSFLNKELDTVVTKKNTNIIELISKKSIPDTAFSTFILFRLFKMAYKCNELTVAESLLLICEKRKDFNNVISLREYLYYKSFLLYSSGKAIEALNALKLYTNKFEILPEILITIARANRALKNDSAAIFWYKKFVSTFPDHKSTPDVHWYLAWKEEEDGKYLEAINSYTKLSKMGKRFNRADEAFFRKGLCYYKNNDIDSAYSVFNSFSKKYPQSSFVIAAQYWKAKCLVLLGKNSEAAKEFRSVMQLSPFDYYSYRSKEALILMGDTLGFPFIDTTFDFNLTLLWLDSICKNTKQNFLYYDSINYYIGTKVALCGLTDYASFYLDGLDIKYPSNLDMQFKIACLYKVLNNVKLSFRIGRRLSWRIPNTSRYNIPFPVCDILYPIAYKELVIKESGKNKVDPYLILAIMRQESIFDEEIKSPAGAIGLMQIMPYTGRIVAQNFQDTFTIDSLLIPSKNIKYGVFYFKKLLEQFNGNVVLSLAAYNGGPNKATEWYERNKRKPFDLFIEDIGFTETRGYVKKVLANYWTYLKLSVFRPVY